MSVAIVVGAQWGDEGKGKVVDLFAEQADMVVRYGGGANAGHTLVKDGQQLITHLVPSGVLHPGTRLVLGDGMVIDPEVLLAEIEACKELGLLAGDELCVAEGAHVVMPFHKIIEGLREERSARDGRSIGTTRRGIGPAYEAKAARRGIRIIDLGSRERLTSLVEQNLFELVPLIEFYGGKAPDAGTVQGWIDAALQAGEKLAPMIRDAGQLVMSSIVDRESVLFEGAQGALLDLDHGTYPYVTSSSTIAAGASQGLGIGPTHIDSVIGISKAYCTRVGEGPFPTEMHGEEEEEWRRAGGEYGATTGRPRRCGWLDIPSLRRVARLCGLTSLAITKLDILSGRGPIQVCEGYRRGGEVLQNLPRDVAHLEPVYREFPGWDGDISGAQRLEDLPQEARNYLSAIEELTEVPLCLVSVGPERDQTIVLRSPF